MKARYARELTQGTAVDAVFVVRSKDLRVARNGDAYLSLELGDRSGSIHAVLFKPGSDALGIPVGGVAQVSGSVTSFKGAKRISVDTLRPASSWDPTDLMASTSRSVDEMVDELREMVRSVRTASLSRVLRAVFGDKQTFAEFCRCPGSAAEHHAYLGGLLEHTLAVAASCDAAWNAYEAADRDLLVCAALLHDVGRLDELTFETDIRTTERGRLLGHVVPGVGRVAAAASRVSLDESLLARLEHAVAAHDPDGSVRPMTIEAVVLRHADALDVQAASFLHSVSGAQALGERWTGSDNAFGRPIMVADGAPAVVPTLRSA